MNNILGQAINTPKSHTPKIDTVDVHSKGFVWKVPELSAALLQAEKVAKKNAVMMPLSREVGTKISFLA